MLEETSLQYLRVRNYLENRRLARGFLPGGVSGVYWFVRDLVPMLTASDEQMLDDWFERPRRWFDGGAEPYFRLRVSNAVRKLGEDKAGCLVELARKVGVGALSAPLLLTQRPLYIGESRNLQVRISDHIEGRTDLAELLTDAGISFSDCVVMWTAFTGEVSDADAGDDSDDTVVSSNRQKVIEALAIRLSYPLLNRKLE